MRTLLAVAALALCGCSAHTNVQIGGRSLVVPPGGSASGASVGINVRGGSATGALIGLGVVAAAIHGGEAEGYGMRYRANPFLAIGPSAPAPNPDPSRRIHEQDCSKPIEDPSANLRCR